MRIKMASIAALVVLSLAVMGGNPDVGVNGNRLDVGISGRIVGTNGGTGPWNGYDYVLVITADDGFDINLQWSDLADSLGFDYTLAMTGSKQGGDSGYLTAANMATIATRPVEVISTGLTQNNTWGILRWDELSVNYPDSVDLDNDPQWIEDWCSIDFAPRTYITDIGHMNYDVAKRHVNQGYKACRGIFHDNAAGGVKFSAPGADRWDKVRLYSNDVGGNLFGMASFRGQVDDVDDPDGAVFGNDAEDNQTTIDNMTARMDSLLYDVADANGSAPIIVVLHGSGVTKNLLSEFVQRVMAKGDTWLIDQVTLADDIRTKHVPIDAPPYAPYAQIEGIAAIDSIFWGPEPLALTATDSFIFHNSNSAAPIAGEIVSVTSGPFTSGLLSQGSPSTAVDPTSNLLGSFTTLVINAAGVIGFGVDALDGKTIVSARIHYYQAIGSELTDPRDFFGVIGVTNPAILAASGSSDISYNFLTVTGEVDWDLPGGTMAGLDFLTDIGPFIYADTDHSVPSTSGFRSVDCTEYIREIADDGVAMFIFGGYKGSSSTLFRIRGNEYSTSTNRPYLIVTTKD